MKVKAKIIADNEDKGKEFKVRRMNYDKVIINYPTGTGLKNYIYDDIELISEGEIDEFLIDNREFLKIRLNRGISVFFYKALKDSLEEEIDEELLNFDLLKDKYSINKRGIWEKELICVLNKNIPIIAKASGHNFKREGYSIEVKPVETSQFVEFCDDQIRIIKEEIQIKNRMLKLYNEAIGTVINRAVSEDLLVDGKVEKEE